LAICEFILLQGENLIASHAPAGFCIGCQQFRTANYFTLNTVPGE